MALATNRSLSIRRFAGIAVEFLVGMTILLWGKEGSGRRKEIVEKTTRSEGPNLKALLVRGWPCNAGTVGTRTIPICGTSDLSGVDGVE